MDIKTRDENVKCRFEGGVITEDHPIYKAFKDFLHHINDNNIGFFSDYRGRYPDILYLYQLARQIGYGKNARYILQTTSNLYIFFNKRRKKFYNFFFNNKGVIVKVIK